MGLPGDHTAAVWRRKGGRGEPNVSHKSPLEGLCERLVGVMGVWWRLGGFLGATWRNFEVLVVPGLGGAEASRGIGGIPLGSLGFWN